MSEVKRYWVPCGSMNMDGWHQDDNEVVLAGEHDKAMKAAQVELAALREELAALKHPMNSARILRKELTAAEQRNAELEKRAADLSALPVIANALKEREDAIELLRQNMHHSRGGTRHAIEASTQKFLDSLCLKPTESGASE